MLNNDYHYQLSVISKESVENSWDILNAIYILGNKYSN